jgi:hypothetical protein
MRPLRQNSGIHLLQASLYYSQTKSKLSQHMSFFSRRHI